MNRLIEILTVGLILILSFLYRFFHLFTIGWVSKGDIFINGMLTTCCSIFHFSDATYYYEIVKGYLSGRGMDIPFPPPFTSFFLIATYKLVGENYFYLKIMYNIIGTAALLFIYLTAKEIFNKKTAFITLLFCSISFTLISITAALNIENIYLFTLSLAIYLFIITYKRMEGFKYSTLLLSLIFGVCSACALLTRSEFILVLLIMLIISVSSNKITWREKSITVIGAFLGILIVIFPWAYRNYQFMITFNKNHPKANLPVFVPVALNGPFNFYQGHNPAANGTYILPFPVEELQEGYMIDLSPENEKHLLFIREGFKLGLKYIMENPEKELLLLPVKMKIFLNGYSNGFFLNNFPDGLEGEVGSYADSFVPKRKVMQIVGVIFFLFGACVIIGKKDYGILRFIPIVMPLLILFVTFMFYGLSRLSHPILPFYFMVIAAGLVYISERLPIFLLSGNYERKLLFSVISVFFLILFYQSQRKVILFKGDLREYGRYSVSVFEIEKR